MRYEIAACVRQRTIDFISIEGAAFVAKEPTLLLGGKFAVGQVGIGVQGFADGMQILDDRARIDKPFLIACCPVSFTLKLPMSTFNACETIKIAFVEEGVAWMLADDDGSSFTVHHDPKTDERWLLPASMRDDYFVRRRSGSQSLLTLNYLSALRASYGDRTAIDFCWHYFLGRLADVSGVASATQSLATPGHFMREVADHVLNSPECLERVNRGESFPDPYLALGVWL